MAENVVLDKIYQWNDIANKFSFENTTLILGNGASIAIDNRFRYESLFKQAEEGILSDDSKSLFSELKTKDFELILNKLRQAEQINKILEIDGEEKTTQIYNDIRSGLIRAVRENHPEFSEIEGLEIKIYNIRNYMKKFKNIISLNYDLIIYWAMMKEDFFEPKHVFKDCFINGTFADIDWERYYEYNGNKATLVFYPHGNLIFVKDDDELEHKIYLKNEKTLLDEVLQNWERENNIPLFVSEGDSNQKRNAVKRSLYLSVVFNEVLRSLTENIVIYGWRIAEQDEYILERICKTSKCLKTIAISIFSSNEIDSKSTQLDFIKKIEKYNKHNNKSIEILFYDACSPECWANSINASKG